MGIRWSQPSPDDDPRVQKQKPKSKSSTVYTVRSVDRSDWMSFEPVPVYSLQKPSDSDQNGGNIRTLTLTKDDRAGEAVLAFEVFITKGNNRNYFTGDFVVGLPVPLSVLRKSYATLCRAQIAFEESAKNGTDDGSEIFVFKASSDSPLSKEEEGRLQPAQRKNAMCAVLLYHDQKQGRSMALRKITGLKSVIAARTPSGVDRFPSVAPSFIIKGRPDDAVLRYGRHVRFLIKPVILLAKRKDDDSGDANTKHAVVIHNVGGRKSTGWFTKGMPEYPGQDFGVPPEPHAGVPDVGAASQSLSILLHGDEDITRVELLYGNPVDVKDTDNLTDEADRVSGDMIMMPGDPGSLYVVVNDVILHKDLVKMDGLPELSSAGLASPFAQAFESVLKMIYRYGVHANALEQEQMEFYKKIGRALMKGSDRPSALDLVVALEILTSMGLGVGEKSVSVPLSCYAPLYVENFGAADIPQAIRVNADVGASKLCWDRGTSVTIMCGDCPYKTYENCEFLRGGKLHLGEGARANEPVGVTTIIGAMVGGAIFKYLEVGARSESSDRTVTIGQDEVRVFDSGTWNRRPAERLLRVEEDDVERMLTEPVRGTKHLRREMAACSIKAASIAADRMGNPWVKTVCDSVVYFIPPNRLAQL